MVDLTSLFDADRTLKACDDALVAAQFNDKPRPYLGASSIGENCSRKLWYRFRGLREVFDAATLKRFRDGHITEQTVISQLCLKFKVSDTQWGFSDIEGHFAGHIDGTIKGIIEAPATEHILEIKATADKKFNELKKYKLELGEKLALRKWSPTYYAQIVLYMFYKGLKRSFHVVATSGGRDWVSIRTEADNGFAKSLIEKARRIIYANDAPEGISRDPAFFDCRFCGMYETCHKKKLPERNCRTCVHSSPHIQGLWKCEFHKTNLDYNRQLVGCENHLFIPSFIDGEIKEVVGNTISYNMKNGSVWVDGVTK